MKKLLTILCLVLLVSCSPPPEVPSNQLVERQGIKYEINSTTPFTGSSVSYHENGQLKKVENYKNGKREGVETYFENGQLEFRGNYKNGEPDGLGEGFYDNGQLWNRENYNNGKLDGLREWFDEDGNLTKTEEWKDGELIE